MSPLCSQTLKSIEVMLFSLGKTLICAKKPVSYNGTSWCLQSCAVPLLCGTYGLEGVNGQGRDVAQWYSGGLLVRRSWVRSPVGAAGEFSSPEWTFCADSYFSICSTPTVTAVARKRPWSFCQKCRWQVTPKHTYTLGPTKSEWADYATVQA